MIELSRIWPATSRMFLMAALVTMHAWTARAQAAEANATRQEIVKLAVRAGELQGITLSTIRADAELERDRTPSMGPMALYLLRVSLQDRTAQYTTLHQGNHLASPNCQFMTEVFYWSAQQVGRQRTWVFAKYPQPKPVDQPNARSPEEQKQQPWPLLVDQPEWPKILAPVDLVSTMPGARDVGGYDLVSDKGKLSVWIAVDSVLSEWRYTPGKKMPRPGKLGIPNIEFDDNGVPVDMDNWTRGRLMKGKIEGGFVVIEHVHTFLLSSDGRLFRNIEGQWIQLATASPGELDGPAEEIKPLQLILVSLDDKAKYALFGWDGEKVAALGMTDKDGQPMGPFVSADQLDTSVPQAVDRMMSLKSSDDQELKAWLKRHAAALHAEKAQPAALPTLQDQLQQNE